MSKKVKQARVMNMTQGPILKQILMFAVPLFAGILLQQTYNLADAAIVGRYLGSDALAAVGCSTSIQSLASNFCVGTGTGLTILIGQQYGAGKLLEMRKYLFHGNILAAAFAGGLTALFVLLAGVILRWLQTPNAIYTDARCYLLIFFLGIPFCMAYNYLAGLMRAVGDSLTPFRILALTTILNIAMDLLFVMVLHLGCPGAAAATTLSQAISAVLCFAILQKRFELFRLLPEDRTWDAGAARRQLIVGVPMGLQYSITAIGGMILQTANNGLGSVYISAYTAGGKILNFTICPFDALSSAVASFAAQNCGAGKTRRIRQGILTGYGTGLVFCLIVGGLLVLRGSEMSMLMLSPDAVPELDAAGRFLACNGSAFFLLAFLNISRQAVQGMGFAGRAMICGVIETICRILISMLLVPRIGFEAICITNGICWLCAALYIVPVCLNCCSRIPQAKEEERA